MDKSLCFLGDVYLPHKVEINISGNVVFNHEYVIIDNSGMPWPNKVNLMVKTNTAKESFFCAEKLYANLDNNHCMDYGAEGLYNTERVLEDSGIRCYGSNLPQKRWVEDKVAGVSFRIFGYNMTSPFNKLDVKTICEYIHADIKKSIDDGINRKIVTIHFGEENLPHSILEQEIVARYAIDMGADLVIGHHPHCIQNVEEYNGKYIFYSLGNSFFPSMKLDAFYNENGVSTRKYYNKWDRWNRKSLVVKYDLIDDKINVYCAKQDDQHFEIDKEIDVSQVQKIVGWKNNKFYLLRRIKLFVKNNIFVDGHIIYFQAFVSKVVKKYNDFRGRK